jgi:hypothetical protein
MAAAVKQRSATIVVQLAWKRMCRRARSRGASGTAWSRTLSLIDHCLTLQSCFAVLVRDAEEIYFPSTLASLSIHCADAMASTTTLLTTLENGLPVPVAELKIIDLALLEASSSSEIEKMAREARNVGFFYLDLRNSPSSQGILDNLPLLYSLSETYFDQPKQAKLNDVRYDQKPSQDRGYVGTRGHISREVERLN